MTLRTATAFFALDANRQLCRRPPMMPRTVIGQIMVEVIGRTRSSRKLLPNTPLPPLSAFGLDINSVAPGAGGGEQ